MGVLIFQLGLPSNSSSDRTSPRLRWKDSRRWTQRHVSKWRPVFEHARERSNFKIQQCWFGEKIVYRFIGRSGIRTFTFEFRHCLTGYTNVFSAESNWVVLYSLLSKNSLYCARISLCCLSNLAHSWSRRVRRVSTAWRVISCTLSFKFDAYAIVDVISD